MLRRCVLVFGMIALGFALSGCTKCGPIWDDWLHGPKSCRSDRS
ncbi:peptidylprolyl isomerase [Bradyrhizobium sp. WBOS7]|uniref:Peptidylprolyl isomerase n=1 Tax=Bradyrhizobium betae TaxID=244734 RepID=A0AAE9NE57_9BRAD|nr:peptidylprolyl isomerase [Bradyrhizobium sp. WBOS2]MDD1532876.1 peptidylprolyl isomerase [Bradyrhizobium sp. WBOS8]MDD1569135.1 peptidylprolyl isomerase [Bradyrhizobium sp. WBOS1]MDD1576254.1 peptidylprolyl isomerase [Bradyrhizobium sp. WBOS7]MDD1581788.1 peptidylprolyl isomerase [Bradyrhizobium sp. WBOS4]MDD1602508.1 peptidylprolyl isomerase [Bradyrhizobium sp. WBOS16]UUO39230.1 peptidylprolyl isomerase [Bradyrhizobium sp. WBOS01]UUO45403.1 peptidylprolyl isomerase [Bradyrhizobium sp. WB